MVQDTYATIKSSKECYRSPTPSLGYNYPNACVAGRTGKVPTSTNELAPANYGIGRTKKLNTKKGAGETLIPGEKLYRKQSLFAIIKNLSATPTYSVDPLGQSASQKGPVESLFHANS